VDGVDLYSLYAKQYGLDVEDESANFVPLCSDEKEMPVLLQITRWHDHLWKYLKTDMDDDSGEEKDHDTDEEDEKRGDQDEDDNGHGDNDEDDGDHSDNDHNVGSSYKYRQTTRHVPAEDTSDSESEDNQMGRKRRRRSLVPKTNSKRHRGLDGSDSGRKLELDDSDPDSEDTESEEACVGRKRNWPNKRPSIQSGKRQRVLVNMGSDSETDAIYSSGEKNLGLDDLDFSDFSEAEASDDDNSGDNSEDEGEEEWMDEDVDAGRRSCQQAGSAKMGEVGHIDISLEGKSPFFNSLGWYYEKGADALAWQEATGDGTLLYGDGEEEGDQR
jgi:hypothetical protein